ncbi:MAG: penicillin acylase family protein, partial [Candidatus Methylomirabilis sp.]|nr:penicillin acylase family protein [Deltaproteobacteria bacterium]
EAIGRTQKLLGRAEKPFSNNWTVSPELTARGFAIVANDPHLGLSNPSIFYPTHGDNKTFTGGPFNISGNTFPGIPGILVGQNERVAWGATVTNYDVTEVYIEDVTVGGGAKTVAYKGAQVPVMTILETFKVRGGDDVLIPIDVVPHHGPQVPDPDLTDDVEGILATGMSVRWTGEEFTRDVEAFLAAAVAEDVEDFMAAFALFGVGAQNWNGADVDGNIAYFPHALIPIRTALARSHEWPPYLPQRGDGTMEWGRNPDGSLKVVPPNRVPQAKNPDQGYIVTANHDISGTLLDNDPLDDEQYLYYLAANGFRGGEIVDQLTDTPEGAWTVESVQAVQNTHRWRMATRFMPFLLNGLANNAAYAGLDKATRDKVRAAGARLEDWDFRAETGVRDPFPGATDPSAEDVESSIGTSLFAVWLNRFSQRAFNDEAAAAGVGLGGDERVKGLLHLLEDVGRTEPGFAIRTAGPDGQSVLWDDITTDEEVETRDRIIVLAMAQAIADMEGPLFGTADMNQWRWGKIHTETFELEGLGAVIPAFNLPGGNILAGRPEGYPRAGALDTVDPAGYGMNGISFHPSSGPAMRMVVEMEPGILTAWNVTPGGTNDVQPGTGLFNPVRIDPATHYGDQLPLWLRNQYRPQLLFWEDVTAVAESRTSLLPPAE